MVCVGRRAGKSVLGLNRCADPAVLGYPVAWFSPTYKMLIEMWREAVRTFAPITARRSVQERRLEYVTGGMLEFWSLDNPDVARGRKYRRIIVDEAAMVPSLLDAWQYAIRPTLADYNGDAWFLSTPKGRNGFWHLWQRGVDGASPDWRSWQMPSSVNPRLALAEIEEMRATLPESVYRQEIEAAFLEDGGSVYRNIAACLTAPTDTTPDAHAGHTLVMGADWARESDFTCFSVGCVQCRCEVARDRFNQVDYHVQVARLQALAERWHVSSILTELNSIGTPVFEMLQRHSGLLCAVVGFTTTAQTKPQLIENMALAFERGEWAWQADPVWTAELEAYERTVSPTTGRSSYSAPAGGHDDTVISRALMLWQAQHYVSSYVDFV